MGDKRQKNQLVLAFPAADRGEAPTGAAGGTESSAGQRGTESPAITEQLTRSSICLNAVTCRFHRRAAENDLPRTGYRLPAQERHDARLERGGLGELLDARSRRVALHPAGNSALGPQVQE